MKHTRSRNACFCSFMAWLGVLTVSCDAGGPEGFNTALPSDRPMPKSLPEVSPTALGQIGIAPTPRNFPNHNDEDIRDMLEQASRLATAAVLIYQWGDPNLLTVSGPMIQRIRALGMTPVVGLSPTSLAHQRKELDVPSRLRSGFFAHPSFKKEGVREAFIAEAKRLAGFKPPYLCLATEINFLALQRMPEFLSFVEVYKEAYRAAKRVSPKTRVFVSFAYDFIRVVDNKEPGKVEDHAKVIDIFRPELDVIAITSYPSEFYERPAEMPRNYYTYLRNYLEPGEEVIVMEIGWPSTGKGTPEEQQQFIERLPILLAGVSPTMTAWSLLHDVRIPAFGDNLASTGLLTTEGKAKSGFRIFSRMAQQLRGKNSR